LTNEVPITDRNHNQKLRDDDQTKGSAVKERIHIEIFQNDAFPEEFADSKGEP
jgi:hypothetical protein